MLHDDDMLNASKSMDVIIKVSNQLNLKFEIKYRGQYFKLKVENVVVDNDKLHHSQHYVPSTILLFSKCYMLMTC